MVTCALAGPRTQSSGRASRKEAKGVPVGAGDGSVSMAVVGATSVGAAVGALVAVGVGASVAVGRWAVGEGDCVAVGSLLLAQAPNKKAANAIKEKCLNFLTFPLLLKSKT